MVDSDSSAVDSDFIAADSEDVRDAATLSSDLCSTTYKVLINAVSSSGGNGSISVPKPTILGL